MDNENISKMLKNIRNITVSQKILTPLIKPTAVSSATKLISQNAVAIAASKAINSIPVSPVIGSVAASLFQNPIFASPAIGNIMSTFKNSLVSPALANVAAHAFQNSFSTSMSIGSVMRTLGDSNVLAAYQKEFNSFIKTNTFKTASMGAFQNVVVLSGYQEILKALNNKFKTHFINIAEQNLDLDNNNLSDTSLSEVVAEFEAVSSPQDMTTFFEKHPFYKFILIRLLTFLENLLYALVIAQFGTEYINRQKKCPEKFINSNSLNKEVRSMDYSRKIIENRRYVNTKILNVRSRNKIKSKVIDKIRFGQLVEVLDKKRKWIKIGYENNNNDYREGWVYSKYISRFRL